LTSAIKTLSEYLDIAPEIDSRYGRTKELLQVGIAAIDPKNRLIGFHSRKENLIAQIAEAVWVLGGSNEVKYLSPFLPRAIEFSDNPDDESPVWRSGYGKRIRSYPNDAGLPIDQLKVVIEILKKDLYSRRAFLVISYPPVDSTPGKDIACNNMIHFLVRRDPEDNINKLYMTVDNRSNDEWWGYSGTNYFAFTFLQEFIANQLGVGLGTYLHNSMSFHIYEPHWDKMKKLLQENLQDRDDIYCPPVQFDSLEVFDSCFTNYKNCIDIINSLENPNVDILIDIWNKFKTSLINSSFLKLSQDSTIYFEIPILYLLWKKSSEFVSYIVPYLESNYYNKTDLFYQKISKLFIKVRSSSPSKQVI